MSLKRYGTVPFLDPPFLTWINTCFRHDSQVKLGARDPVGFPQPELWLAQVVRVPLRNRSTVLICTSLANNPCKDLEGVPCELIGWEILRQGERLFCLTYIISEGREGGKVSWDDWAGRLQNKSRCWPERGVTNPNQLRIEKCCHLS